MSQAVRSRRTEVERKQQLRCDWEDWPRAVPTQKHVHRSHVWFEFSTSVEWRLRKAPVFEMPFRPKIVGDIANLRSGARGRANRGLL